MHLKIENGRCYADDKEISKELFMKLFDEKWEEHGGEEEEDNEVSDEDDATTSDNSMYARWAAENNDINEFGF